MQTATVTIERLRDLLSYDPDTGLFTWKITKGCANAGDVAGADEYGYRAIRIDTRMYRAHRLAWFITFGVWPPHDVDHINRDRADNRLANLRLATRSQNLANSRPRKGLKGAHYDKRDKVWIGSIRKNYRTHHLGSFKTEQDAHEAYAAAAPQVHGDFARAK